jgi:hypothetical protein
MVDLDQSSGGIEHADIITGSVADWLTKEDVFRWNLQHQNPADVQWFAEIDPESMDITGTALLAFGTASSGI